MVLLCAVASFPQRKTPHYVGALPLTGPRNRISQKESTNKVPPVSGISSQPTQWKQGTLFSGSNEIRTPYQLFGISGSE